MHYLKLLLVAFLGLHSLLGHSRDIVPRNNLDRTYIEITKKGSHQNYVFRFRHCDKITKKCKLMGNREWYTGEEILAQETKKDDRNILSFLFGGVFEDEIRHVDFKVGDLDGWSKMKFIRDSVIAEVECEDVTNILPGQKIADIAKVLDAALKEF